MHEGAPAHFRRPVRDTLRSAYRDKGIDATGLPRSTLNLSPSDFHPEHLQKR
jgi:hypothetical protein